MVGQFANAIEDGDVDTVVALLTDDAWLTMPPYPYQYQGGAAIGNFLRVRSALHQMPLRLVPTRANGQPRLRLLHPLPANRHRARLWADGAHTRGKQHRRDHFFADSSVFPHFGLPRTMPKHWDARERFGY